MIFGLSVERLDGISHLGWWLLKSMHKGSEIGRNMFKEFKTYLVSQGDGKKETWKWSKLRLEKEAKGW